MHRQFGSTQQIGGRAAVLREEGDPDARPHVDDVVADEEWVLERRADFPGDDRGRLQVGPAGRDDAELVASQTGHRVRVTHRAAQALRDRLEDDVAVVASERLVDLPELVQVDQEHAALLVGPVCGCDRPIHAVSEQGVVRQPGEIVVEHPVLERLGVGLTARDVADAADGQRLLTDLHMAHVHFYGEARAVLAAAHRLGRLRGNVLRTQQAWPGSGEIEEGVVMAARDDELERLPDHLVLVIAEQPSRRSVERFDEAILAGRHDPVRHVLQHRPCARLAVAQGGVERGDRLERALQLPGPHEEVHEGRDLGLQHLPEDGREDEVDGAAGIRRGRLLGLRVLTSEGGHEDDRRQPRLASLPDELGGLVSVQDRHGDVHEDHGEGLSHDSAQRGAPRLGLDDRVTQRREHLPDHKALGRIVVDDENGRGRPGSA